MSTDKGYIKLYRNVRDHWLWKEEPFSIGQAWIDLLMMVNHEDKKVLFNGRLVTVKRGSCITSIRKLADRWKRNKRTVSKFLDLFEEDGMIVQKRDSHCTTINVVNYSNYQATRDTKCTTQCTTKYPPSAPRSAPQCAHKQYTKEDTIEDTKEDKALDQDEELDIEWVKA